MTEIPQGGPVRPSPDERIAALERRIDELEQRRRHLEAVLDVLPVGVWIADANGRLVARNEAGAAIWGNETRLSERPEDYADDYRAWWPDGRRVEADEWAMARAIRNGETSRAEEIEIESASGERKRILNYAVPIRDEQGGITGGVAVNVDVTDQRRAEAATQRQAQVLQAVGQAVIVTDLEGRITYWNAAAEAIYGWAAEEAAGRGVMELTVPEQTRDEAARVMSSVAETGAWEGEFTVARRDGSTFPARVSLRAVRRPGGEPGGFVGLTTDLTAQKEALREREELIGALELERARLEGIFREAPAFIAVVRGPDHVFEMANPSFHRALGGDPGELLGRPAREALPDIASQGFADLLDGVRESGEPYAGREERIVLRQGRPEGPREVYCNFVFQPVRDAAGSVSRIVIHGVDVTDLVRARQEAERASRAKSDFLAVISHELRTPLNAILGYVDLMDLGVPADVPDEVARYLGRIRLSASHLRQLIDDILTVGRLEAGREGVELEIVRIDEVAEEVRAIMEPAMRAKGLDFEVQAGDMPEAIVSDPRKIRQILVNLVGNAAKFTTTGSVEVRFAPDGERDDRFLIRVADTGLGIEAENLEKLFEPFWQADRERLRTEGAGLGLAITRRLARMLGGRVDVESSPGRGSVFTVELPLIPAVEPPEGSGGSGGQGKHARL